MESQTGGDLHSASEMFYAENTATSKDSKNHLMQFQFGIIHVFLVRINTVFNLDKHVLLGARTRRCWLHYLLISILSNNRSSSCKTLYCCIHWSYIISFHCFLANCFQSHPGFVPHDECTLWKRWGGNPSKVECAKGKPDIQQCVTLGNFSIVVNIDKWLTVFNLFQHCLHCTLLPSFVNLTIFVNSC